jgi:hypothetical protein
LKTGERARITYGSRTVDAKVELASENGRSLFLTFDAVLTPYIGRMPVLWRAGLFRDLITDQIVRVEALSSTEPLRVIDE